MLKKRWMRAGMIEKLLTGTLHPINTKNFLYRNELICIARFNILTFNGAIICIQMTTTTCIKRYK